MNIDNLAFMMQAFKGHPYFDELSLDLIALQEIYKGITITYQSGDRHSEEVDGQLVFVDNTTSIVSITPEQVAEVTELINEINHSLPSRRVIEILERTIDEHGKPLGIRTDNGPEFTSHLFQNWLTKNEIEWVKIQKGKPQQNAIVERFNRTYREDILDANLFFSLNHVYEVTQPWKEEYNQERPHEVLNYKTPNEYAA